jgi:hypothetical protein
MNNDNPPPVCRDREQYRSNKIDTEEDMREMLSSSKQRAIVANSVFHKILDNVGILSKEHNVLTQGRNLQNLNGQILIYS